MGGDEACERVGGGGLIEPHGFLLLPERTQRAYEIGGLADVGERFEAVAHIVRQLAAIDIERRPALARNDGEGERQRRVRHVGAADVEGPGDRMRVRHHQRIGAQLHELRADARELRLRGLAGEAQVVQGHGAERRGRAVRPERIDQVGLDRDQRRAGRGAGLGKLLRALDRVQPGIVAEAVAGGEVCLDPFVRRRLDRVLDGEQRGIHLLARLQRVASVDEQHGALDHDDRGAGRAGEAGEPGQPLLGRRDIFVLVAIGPRHDEAGQVAPGQFGAQRRDARRACSTLRVVLERLEPGLEHGGIYGAGGRRAQGSSWAKIQGR